MKIARRNVLRGAGVALGLPWLESLAPRTAAAETAPRKRFIAMFFPNGTANYAGWWKPAAVGSGNAWSLSTMLQPIGAMKAKATVLTNVENYSPFGGSTDVEPSHSQLCGAFLTCTPCSPNISEIKNGTSADQIIAKQLAAPTPLASMQVGLTTKYGFPDGRHPANSRSISWASPTEPLYKVVNPQAVFDTLVSATGGGAGDPAGQRRRALRKSALDYVLESAQGVQKRVGSSDRARLDQYLTSVRELEQRVGNFTPMMPATGGGTCALGQRPPNAYGTTGIPAGYTRELHAQIMMDLITTAIQCDLTRVLSFMLDDERSEYAHVALPLRNFTNTGTTLAGGNVVGTHHDLQHSGDSNNGFATVTYWCVEKAAQLATKLDAIKEENGKTALDNSVLYFGSSMHGGNHAGNQIPSMYFGSGGGVLKTDQHISFASDQRVSDVYLTFMQKVYGLQVSSFANSRGVVSQILA